MRPLFLVGTALACLGLGASPASALMDAPPEVAGPPRWYAPDDCPLSLTASGGNSAGPAVPVRALALGAPIDRNSTSFQTGGSGTAFSAWQRQRRQAGLQYEPQTFDPAGRARPSVFAVPASRAANSWAYQRLPLKASGTAYSARAMIFAQANSPTSGRIASLALTFSDRPAARPKLTVSWRERCRVPMSILVYAPDMSVAHLRQLFSRRDCWTFWDSCAPVKKPRGRVLFVSSQRSGVGYEYRWVDYGLLLPG